MRTHHVPTEQEHDLPHVVKAHHTGFFIIIARLQRILFKLREQGNCLHIGDKSDEPSYMGSDSNTISTTVRRGKQMYYL